MYLTMNPKSKSNTCIMSPIKKGSKVKVIACSDECGYPEFIGEIGMVYELNTNNLTGNTKSDPLYEVLFTGGRRVSFWEEELQVVNMDKPEEESKEVRESRFQEARSVWKR